MNPKCLVLRFARSPTHQKMLRRTAFIVNDVFLEVVMLETWKKLRPWWRPELWDENEHINIRIALMSIILANQILLRQEAGVSAFEGFFRPDAVFRHPGCTGQSILDALLRVAAVEKVATELGVYVQSINGIRGDSNRGWMALVNRAEIIQSVDSFITDDDDQIEWRLVRIN